MSMNRLWRKLHLALRPLQRYVVLGFASFIFALGITLISAKSLAQVPQMATHWEANSALAIADLEATTLITLGQQAYADQQYTLATEYWQRAERAFRADGDEINGAIALANLALTYLQLGEWDQAAESMSAALAPLSAPGFQQSDSGLRAAAHVLDVSGQFELERGQASAAYDAWVQAANYHQRASTDESIIRNLLNQAQALRAMGLGDRALALLQGDISQRINQQPDTLTKATWLRRVGTLLQSARKPLDAEVLETEEDTITAEEALTQSLQIAQTLNSGNEIAYATMALGNFKQAQGEFEAAATYYQQVIDSNVQGGIKLQAYLNQVPVLLKLGEAAAVSQNLERAFPLIAQLPVGRLQLHSSIKYAQANLDLIELGQVQQVPSLEPIARLLASANQQAEAMGDRPTQAYILGTLGWVYWHDANLPQAEELTRRAISLAEAYRTPESVYRWWRQLGKIYRRQAELSPEDTALKANLLKQSAEAYEQAFSALQALRKDIVGGNPEFQIAFQDQVEDTIYREYIDVLFRAYDAVSGVDASPVSLVTLSDQYLSRAREVAQALQVSELENYLQEPCTGIDTEALDNLVDNTETTTAIVYSIVLPDRIEVLLKLPQEEQLHRYAATEDERTGTPITEDFVKEVAREFRLDLERAYSFAAVKRNGERVYDWLLKDFRSQLDERGIETLVFVSDTLLRNIPMATLHDGTDYIVERFAVAQSLSLQLNEPQALPRNALSILAAGLVKPPPQFEDRFRPLLNVDLELDSIQALEATSTTRVKVKVLREFNAQDFNRSINDDAYQIVHIATHGEFNADPNKSILLTNDDEGISVRALDKLFKARGLNRTDVIELLILSACETASGDGRDTLGIAGTAVRAGARSTIASLWSIDDAGGAELARLFYKYLLEDASISKAEALHLAQKALKRQPGYDHPRYWAPLILVGNWL